MKSPVPVLLLALAAAFSSAVHATPFDEMRTTTVSMLEFGSFRLEVALSRINDWPMPIEGASVSYKPNPDQIEIIVAMKNVRADAFRSACEKTLGRVREFLYVDANGVAPMGRSNLGAYFRGPWRGGDAREGALRIVDASALIRVDVVGRGNCRAALINAPVTFETASPK